MEKVSQNEIRQAVRAYVLKEFLQGEDPAALENDTLLISSGVLDSIASAKLVSFLEDRFDVRFAAHEVNEAKLDSVDRIAATVEGKL